MSEWTKAAADEARRAYIERRNAAEPDGLIEWRPPRTAASEPLPPTQRIRPSELPGGEGNGYLVGDKAPRMVDVFRSTGPGTDKS